MDPFDLNRLVKAQAPVYARVVAELRAGRKRTHWMWFIFPQVCGLGESAMAQRFAIESPEEARAYLAHAVLGVRLRECTELLLNAHVADALELLGHPDDLKFLSSMTLFAEAGSEWSGFRQAIGRFFKGMPDTKTLELLGISGAADGTAEGR
jgi:uncharacterized protein (DUF1810 family)